MESTYKPTDLLSTFPTLQEAIEAVPLGMLTLVLPDSESTTIFLTEKEMTEVTEETPCLECESGIATYTVSSELISVTATNGADVNKELLSGLSKAYTEMWTLLYELGLLQPSILLNSDGEMFANPLDKDKVEISENFTEED